MKQVLTYISSDKCFNTEHQMAAKIQIDNSLSLGWKPEDIIMATNFQYEYHGVRSLVIGNDNYCQRHWPATKIYVLVRLFQDEIFHNDELYWYHDFDCFQLNPLADGDPPIENACLALTNYGRMPRLCSASMFFRNTAGDLFQSIKDEVDKGRKGEEEAIARLRDNNTSIYNRIKHLNITYAFHRFNLLSCLRIADLPIKAAHFHLTPDKYDFYVRGNNQANLVLIPQRLIEIFHQHGFKG